MDKAPKIFDLETDGFVGRFYEGIRHKDCAVIFLPGAKQGEEMTVKAASYLTDEGYSVLILGFYLWRGLSKEMYGIPVDYVERAVRWLLANHTRRIAMLGTSTGAGYALVSASLIPAIGCVVAVSPFEYVMEGMKSGLFPQHCSQYTWHGKDLPYSSYAQLDEKSLWKAFREFLKDKDYDFAHIGRYSYDKSVLQEASRIRVEDMKADLLLLAPQKDDCWPSEAAVPRMEKLLKEKDYPYRVKAVVYPKASHMLGYMPPDMGKTTKKMLSSMMPVEKKYPQECEQARKDSTEEILAFLRAWREGGKEASFL